MTKEYVHVRMRRPDFEKIMKEKKTAMERDLFQITGKSIKLKGTQLFNLAANSTWELSNYYGQLLNASGSKKKKVKI